MFVSFFINTILLLCRFVEQIGMHNTFQMLSHAINDGMKIGNEIKICESN